ncbi:MAG: PaaI family thioesterase [Parvibaculum sp.]|jgi:uncharacterized protein (TIGR00369 family)|uniref:PaaI family thioesterase n=1 Tax=Parvibaculum sp. TaxID=2024848 RepID=UPI003C75BEF6
MSDRRTTEAGDLSKSLGQERVVLLDKEAGRAIIEYRCGMHMCHSGGVAQGGFVTGWIDAAMAHATMAATDFAFTPMSLEIKVSFFKPTAPGLVHAEAWIEQRGRSTVFLEGRLTNEAGDVLAKATSTVRLIPREKFA